MHVYTSLPKNHGERELAELLVSWQDPDLHLWFNVRDTDTRESDIVIWHQKAGVFVVEVKAIAVRGIEAFGIYRWQRRGNNPQRSPQVQAYEAFEDLRFRSVGPRLERAGESVPFISPTVAWPRISRSEWDAYWQNDPNFCGDYAERMIFSDDLSNGPATFAGRLRHVYQRPVRGKGARRPFVHSDGDLRAFRVAVSPEARPGTGNGRADRGAVTPGWIVARAPRPHLVENGHGNPRGVAYRRQTEVPTRGTGRPLVRWARLAAVLVVLALALPLVTGLLGDLNEYAERSTAAREQQSGVEGVNEAARVRNAVAAFSEAFNFSTSDGDAIVSRIDNHVTDGYWESPRGAGNLEVYGSLEQNLTVEGRLVAWDVENVGDERANGYASRRFRTEYGGRVENYELRHELRLLKENGAWKVSWGGDPID